jgi:hypothetical protein
MEEYPLRVEEIVSWFRLKEAGLQNIGIALAGVRESHTNKPAATADFDTAQALGNISVWVSGEVDFHVLGIDGKDTFQHHEKVQSLGDPSLESAFRAFLQSMTR